jgi:hypothetical protein
MNTEPLVLAELDPVERERFVAEWRTAESQFSEDPGRVVSQGDWLVQQVMEARGYPAATLEERSDLSTDHAGLVQNYRTARRIAHLNRRGAAGIDDLRKALVSYRALFQDLLGVE